MAKKTSQQQVVPQPRQWTSSEEIDGAIPKLQRRIAELEALDVRDSAKSEVAIGNFRESLREVFGSNSPEYLEHQHARLWHGFMYADMPEGEIIEAKESGNALHRSHGAVRD